MRLISIEVENWRCFLRPLRVQGFGQGLNIISAPNGSGKSKLFEALHWVLLESHGVRKQDLAAIIPWGRNLSPRVAVEFREANSTFRLRKQYGDSASAHLQRLENGHYLPLADGGPAEQLLRNMLSSDDRGRKAPQPQFWGIAQVLWAPQGELRLAALSESLAASIRETLSAQLEGPRGQVLGRAIEALYGTHYTATGRYRSGKVAPPVVQLQELMPQAQLEAESARRDLERFGDLVRSVASLEESWTQISELVTTLEQRIESLSLTAAAEVALQTRRDLESQRVDSIESTAEALRQSAQRLGHQRDLVEAAKATSMGLRGDLQRLIEAQRAAEAGEGEAQVRRETARKAQASLKERQREASDAEAFRRLSAEIARQRVCLERIAGAVAAIGEHAAMLRTLAAPSADELTRIRLALRARDEANTRIQASLLHLEINPQQHGSLTVFDPDPHEVPLLSGTPVTLEGSPEIRIEAERLGAMRFWGPSGSLDEHRSALQQAQATIASLTSSYDTDDIDSLERLSQRRAEVERALSEATARRNTLCGDDPEESLEDDLRTMGQQRSELLVRYPAWDPCPPDSSHAITHLEAAEANAAGELASAEERLDAARQAAEQARGRVATQRALITQAEAGQAACVADMERLEAALGTPEALDERHGHLVSALDAARKRMREAEDLLRSHGTGATEELAELKTDLADAQEAADSIREDLIRARAMLDAAGDTAPYARLARAEEHLDQLKSQAAEEALRAGAIKLLHDAYQFHKARAFTSVVGGVERVATGYLHRIAGDGLGEVKMGDGFAPSGLVPPEVRHVVGPENLSGGEAEQLYFVTRLALAEVLAQEERQMVVLDDVLTATDPQRFARIAQLLTEASERLQIVILTCHPDRYAELDATRIDLAAARRAAA